MEKTRIGIFGLGRGENFIDNLTVNGGEIVAVCEQREKKIAECKDQIENAAIYNSFDEFIEHPMDAVVLANYFAEHTPYAIRCLEKGIHVLSECTSNGTMAQGVALVRAAEKSNSIYMLAENYPFMLFNKEMKRVCDGGTLGRILYAEGEYNHPFDMYDAEACATLAPGERHWRNFLPRSYYITHSLAPIMYATGSVPVRVTAMPVANEIPADCFTARYVNDAAAIITTLNNDGSVFKVTGCAAFGAHGNSYRICGVNGQIENIRGMGEKVMLRYNGWQIPEGMQETNCYDPEHSAEDAAFAKNAGHGGGDFFVAREFLECIRTGKKPAFDVYFATTMASVAILAHRSILSGNQPYDIPDFRKEKDRVKYENDHSTPIPFSDGTEPDIPCNSRPCTPSELQKENYRKAIEKYVK
ncbi:MAG: Gfo/Idh/MocA family oxidoreductase [Clostridia bacterium]|nr:Gfo/Idh/MocA family oxidoreductase [Clostridia bacterium]